MVRKSILPGALALSLALPLAAAAQTTTWTVVAAEHASVPLPPLAGSTRSMSALRLGDVGQNRWGFWNTAPADDAGLWMQTASGLQRYLQLGRTGAALGPGRTGAEQNHVFIERYDGYEDAGRDGGRVFLARAGDPASTASQSNGVWRRTAGGNVEVARSQDSGVLGPGLPGWYFHGGSGFRSLLATIGGGVMINALLVDTSTAEHDAILRHVPGQGNQPCAVSGVTDAAYAPGFTAGDSFTRWYGSAPVSVDRQGRIFARLGTSGSRAGLFELCAGAPRALAADEVTGDLGPGLDDAAGTFVDFFNAPVFGAPGTFHFVATARPTGGGMVNGVYRNDGARNRPIALSAATGALSPHWGDATFSVFDEDTLDAAGEYVVFGASVNASGNAVRGLWRAGTAAGPQPVAIAGTIGDYAPEQGLSWTSFYENTVFPNGDILVNARTSDNAVALWLLPNGGRPRRVLRPGQTVPLQTAAGVVQATIDGYALPGGGGSEAAQYLGGRDGWAAADGTVLAQVSLANYGKAWIVARPSDYILQDGFGG
jgi:hypothetical protein